ncbi:MAG: hydrogenase maturation nickel metallochaperone HypA [Mariprofundaceae bacterium]
MHELSLAREMVRIVQMQADSEHFSKVKKIYLSLGALSCVSAESLSFAFDAVRTDMLKDTELQIEKVPVSGQCSNCGAETEMWQHLEPCKQCGTEILASEGGEEIKVRELEVC